MNTQLINDLKKEKNLTNLQISEMTGIAISTLDKITAGVNLNPKLSTIQAICKVLGCTLDDLDDNPSTNRLNLAERTHIEKYRALDDHGKQMVDVTLELEYKRMCELNGASDKENEDEEYIYGISAAYGGGIEETRYLTKDLHEITALANKILADQEKEREEEKKKLEEE